MPLQLRNDISTIEVAWSRKMQTIIKAFVEKADILSQAMQKEQASHCKRLNTIRKNKVKILEEVMLFIPHSQYGI